MHSLAVYGVAKAQCPPALQRVTMGERAVRRNRWITWMLVATLAAAGCATSKRPIDASNTAAKNLIFNQNCKSFPVLDVPREDWPTSEGFNISDEQIAFREVIVNREGRYHSSRSGDLYRRFYSVRTGRGYR